MKNQYVGDIGDYTKFGFLRAFESAGLHIGLNWYLTPDDSRSDGRHITYLDAPCDTPDFELYCILKQVVQNNIRRVSELERVGLIRNAIYYNEPLDFSKTLDKMLFRAQWHSRALAALSAQDVVLLDPDNGLEVKSTRPHHIHGNKFTAYKEVVDYYYAGASVIVYNHRDRSPQEKYLERFTRFRDIESTANAEMFYLRASRFSMRDYLFLIQPKHNKILRTVVDNMLKTSWSKYLTYYEIT
ncbi:MAG: hypothetical protein ACK5LX_16815 [Oscillospiraceae bacterium]